MQQNAPSRRWFPDLLTDKSFTPEPLYSVFRKLLSERDLGMRTSQIEERFIGDKDLTVLRFKFWDEYNKATHEHRMFNADAVTKHAGGAWHLSQSLTREQWAYILLEPLNYVDTYRDLYNTSILRMRQILSADPIDPASKKLDLNKARLQFNIFQMLDNRILGQNVNVSLTNGKSTTPQMGQNFAIKEAITASVKTQSIRDDKPLSLEDLSDDDDVPLRVEPLSDYDEPDPNEGRFDLSEFSDTKEVYRKKNGANEVMIKVPEWIEHHDVCSKSDMGKVMIITDVREWLSKLPDTYVGNVIYRMHIPPIIYKDTDPEPPSNIRVEFAEDEYDE